MSPSVSNLCLTLAVQVKARLDPVIFERIIHGDLRGRSNEEGMDIARQLEALAKSAR